MQVLNEHEKRSNEEKIAEYTLKIPLSLVTVLPHLAAARERACL